MPQITLDLSDAAELAEALTFLANWLSGSQQQILADSFAAFVGHPAYNTATLCAAAGQAGAPAAGAPVRARARTNELDAGERRQMIASEESPLGCGLPWTGVLASRGSVRESGGVVSHPPIRPPAWAGTMTVCSGDRAAQSDLRARQGRLRMIGELTRGHATPPGSVTAPLSGARGVAGLRRARRRRAGARRG